MSNLKSRKGLNDTEVQGLYKYLLEQSVQTKLPRGALTEAARKFGVIFRMVQRVWKKQKDNDDPCDFVRTLKKRYKGNVRRKMYGVDKLQELVRKTPLRLRVTFNALIEATSISSATL